MLTFSFFLGQIGSKLLFPCVLEPENGTEPTDPDVIGISTCNRFQEAKKGEYDTKVFVPKSKFEDMKNKNILLE